MNNSPWNKLKKAVTFSFDDGVTQDKRLIEIFDKYGLKCTFNINSGLLGNAGCLIRNEVTVSHVKPRLCEVKSIYKNHEVAAHTLTHPLLPSCTDEEIIRQVENDRTALSETVGYDVRCMAYPCGGENTNDRVEKIIKENTQIKFARTIVSSHSFDIQKNLFRFNPTVHIGEKEKMLELAEEFIMLKPVEPKLFYIWGHSYEFDIDNRWKQFEEFCSIISKKDDIFYGTNSEVIL